MGYSWAYKDVFSVIFTCYGANLMFVLWILLSLLCSLSKYVKWLFCDFYALCVFLLRNRLAL